MIILLRCTKRPSNFDATLGFLTKFQHLHNHIRKMENHRKDHPGRSLFIRLIQFWKKSSPPSVHDNYNGLGELFHLFGWKGKVI